MIGIDAHSEKIVASFIEMHDGVEGKPRNLVTTVEALEPTFKKRIQGGEVAVLEASTNSFSIASRLNAIGIDVLYTLIQTARLNDVDPQAWLADVLARMPSMPVSRLPELLPWNWSKVVATTPEAA